MNGARAESAALIFAGSANVPLAAAVAARFGVELGARTIRRFPDGEISITIEQSVRRREVYIVQPTSPRVDENLVELLAFADACRRASAERIVAVLPYFGYARSDKRLCHRGPIAAAMVADLLQAVGFDHVITLDVHAPQIEGFFNIPFDDLTAIPLLTDALRPHLPAGTVVVSPDAGRVRAASDLAGRLGAPLAVMQKRRESDVETDVTHIAGEVRGRPCAILDDMISTGGTIAESVAALREAGADRQIFVAATHGLFLPGAREKLDGVDKIWATDSVARNAEPIENLEIVSVAPLLANAIQRIVAAGSLGWVEP